MAEAGWYQDPHNSSQQRYWDGQTWTEHTHVPAPFQATQGDPAAYHGGYSPVGYSRGSINDLGEWFSRSFRVVLSNIGPLMVLALLGAAAIIVPYVVGFLGFGFGEVFTDSTVVDDPNWVPNVNAGVLVVAAVALVVGLALNLVFLVGQFGVMHRGHDIAQGRTASKLGFGAAIKLGFRRLPRVVGWGLVFLLAYIVLVGLIIGVIAGLAYILGDLAGLAFLLVLLAIPFFFWLAIRLSMVYPALALGPKGLNPFAESFRVTQGRFFAILGRLLLLLVVVMIASWIGSFVALLVVGAPVAALSASEPTDGEAFVALFSSLTVSVLIQFGIATILNLFLFSGLVGLYGDAGGQIDEQLSPSLA